MHRSNRLGPAGVTQHVIQRGKIVGVLLHR